MTTARTYLVELTNGRRWRVRLVHGKFPSVGWYVWRQNEHDSPHDLNAWLSDLRPFHSHEEAYRELPLLAESHSTEIASCVELIGATPADPPLVFAPPSRSDTSESKWTCATCGKDGWHVDRNGWFQIPTGWFFCLLENGHNDEILVACSEACRHAADQRLESSDQEPSSGS